MELHIEWVGGSIEKMDLEVWEVDLLSEDPWHVLRSAEVFDGICDEGVLLFRKEFRALRFHVVDEFGYIF